MRWKERKIMPTSENGKSIEKMYWDHVRAMSPAERYRKALRLNASLCAMVETQIREKYPNMNKRAMQFALARRRYWNEPKVLQMLDDAEKAGKEAANE
jgi:hypothetical protein